MAMFDVKPVKKSGGLDFEKISQMKTEINLRREAAILPTVKPILVVSHISRSQVPVAKKEVQPVKRETKKVERQGAEKPVMAERKIIDSKHSILEELERTFAEPLDPVVELARAGAKIHPFIKQEPRPHLAVRTRKGKESEKKRETTTEKTIVPIVNFRNGAELENFWMSPGSSIPEPSIPRPVAPNISVASVYSPASKEMDFWLTRLGSLRQAGVGIVRPKTKRFPWAGRPRRNFLIYLTILALPGLFLWWVVQGGIGARDNVIQNGSNAVANLEEAKQKLENLEFSGAANSFALAYDDLNRASGTLNELGASFLSVFGSLPGLNKVKAANNLVEAGQNISKAGENLALALGMLYNSNPFSLLNASADSTSSPRAGLGSSKSLSKLLSEFRAVLVNADRNIKKANGLLADIDNSVIPEDKQPLLLNFKERIPQFQEYIGGAINYSDFLLKFIGSSGRKIYLVLLQNNSELRPTGGFPGTYAVATFEDGNLVKIFVDDIYQIDSQLRENIIPPLQMQHITPTWGMRDANWFADFPTSAKKVQEFYHKDGGGGIDGVLAFTPDVIAEIFRIIGPIDMPEYDLTLNADNFLTEIQNEVEYEADRSEPKKILTDLQPKFFERLANQDQKNWLEVFRIIIKAAEQKHFLAYFNDPVLEKTALENKFGGEIKNIAGDYLQVVFSNIKGSKTDFVTDNSMDLETTVGKNGVISHTLTINRAHNGGDSEYGFYNRDNSAYVKVFVPKGAVLESIVGQSITDFKPLINYDSAGFKEDPDLDRIESGVSHPMAGVDEFEESGKTAFGFWLIVKPKQTKSVVLKYRTPVAEAAGGSYNLYWQKQSGTGKDLLNFSFKLPEGAMVVNYSPDLQPLGDNLVLNSDLSVDREIRMQFK